MKLIIFLLVNFGALAIGGFLMGEGPVSEWYRTLNVAPWTPPGWVFGAAWTTIMITYSIYMTVLWGKMNNKSTLLVAFVVQLILNISWNPVFFFYHWDYLGLVIIVLLTLLIAWFFFHYLKTMKNYSLLILPYLGWLIIATSLNAYICLNN